MSEQNKGTQIL